MPSLRVNPAKHAQRLKHKRKVLGAIRYMQAKKKREAPVKEQNKETKDYIVQTLNWKQKHIAIPTRKAQNAAKEDWELGPLRPNRASGGRAKTYGVAERAYFSRPAVPKHWFGAKPAVQKRMKWKMPENVLNGNYPIVKGDRVLVIRGREEGKIGTVTDIIAENNTIVVKGVNQAWIDSSLIDKSLSETPKHEYTIPLPYDHVRLVIPYTLTRNVNGRIVKSREDVVVEAIEMERHIRGIDPFTGEYSRAIPEEHQIDPKTEEVIWHRYVAGTRTPIEWPWEKKDESAGTKAGESNHEVTEEKKGVKDLIAKANPLNWLGESKDKQDGRPATEIQAEHEAEEYDPEKSNRARPREHDFKEYDDDTPRNLVDPEAATFIPYLVYPPHPETVEFELNEYGIKQAQKEKAEAEKDEKKLEELRAQRMQEIAEKKLAKEREIAERISTMKTPMQIRWELAQAKKEKLDPSQPPSEDLLLALGKHMAEKGVKVEKLPKAKKQVDELAA